MKTKTKRLSQKLSLATSLLLILSCCYVEDDSYSLGHYPQGYDPLEGQEEYTEIKENPFILVQDDPLSTFSVDVDVASYSNMRRFINQGHFPEKNAIRTEELVNYFSYSYEKPTDGKPVKISNEVGECSWNEENRLVRIAVKAKEIPSESLSASNFVFLIDVSGSMHGSSRLELVKSSLKLLVNNLRESDKVSIVVYADKVEAILPATSGQDKQKILEAISTLTAGGATAGGAGIQLAYKTAREAFIQGGNNRVILCTDGDFNVGVSTPEGLEKLIEEESKSGVYLTVLGYGMGNYKDNRMQVLAQKGNGNHAYIDNLPEANRVLVNEFGSNLYVVAKDVKLQIEFNPAYVHAYRLIGYETRMLNHEDFNDDQKDAADMGPGHAVTALYEVVPAKQAQKAGANIDDLIYKDRKGEAGELMTVKLRYKEPDSDRSEKIDQTVFDQGNPVSRDFHFASAVAMFSHLLRNSEYKGNATFDKVITLAQDGMDDDELGYKREFIRLVEAAKGL